MVGARIGAKTHRITEERATCCSPFADAPPNFLALLVVTHFMLFVDRVNLAARPE